METICKIIRVEQSDQGALGVLILFGHLFCVTLEPDSEVYLKEDVTLCLSEMIQGFRILLENNCLNCDRGGEGERE